MLRTKNETYGFYGTIAHAGVDRDEAWVVAFQAISRVTGFDHEEAIRAFLDGRVGRHFADSVANHLHRGATLQVAVDAAVGEWMGRRIGRHACREFGINAELPELVGWVGYFHIQRESDAERKQ